MEENTPIFLTISQAARLLKVNNDKLRRWAHGGVIEAVCLLSTQRRVSLRIKLETIHDLWVRAIVQEELDRAYEQEWKEQEEYSLEDQGYEPDVMDALQ